jgi:ketosteroid isomerase-like protein
MTHDSAVDGLADHRAAFADALRRGDADAASAVYATDAHVIAPSTEPIVGRDHIRAFWQAGIDAGVVDVALSSGGAEQSDGLAYETGEYEFKVGSYDGGRVVERGHYVQVYQRQPDGTWQRAVEMFSPAEGRTTGGNR